MSEAARRRRADTAGFAIRFAGGVASFAEEGSPFNKIAGIGFAGVPVLEDLNEVERAFAANGSAVQVELAHLADPAVVALLMDRGYRLTSFENVLGIALKDVTVTGDAVQAVAVHSVVVRRSNEEELGSWLDVVAEGVGHPDIQRVPAHEEFSRGAVVNALRDLVAAADITRYVALHNGEVAGGASFRVAGGVAQLTGAATAPAHRRQGIQTALLAARLADAAAAGCDVAVVTTQPGSKSQQNAQRRGFDLLYTRAILVKDVGSVKPMEP